MRTGLSPAFLRFKKTFNVIGRQSGNLISGDRNIWEKVWRAWLWVSMHELHLAEWFAKVDDDTFLFPENLRWFVQHRRLDSGTPLYFGQKLFHTPAMWRVRQSPRIHAAFAELCELPPTPHPTFPAADAW